MSISQIKKQFEELSVSLGRDVHCLEKLRKLKESFTELRTRLASVESESTHAIELKELAFVEANKAKSELADAQQEIHRLRQVVGNLTRDMETATKTEPVIEAEDDEIREMTRDQRQYRAMIKELRRNLPYCPLPAVASHHRADVLRSYDRNSLSAGWSHQEIWCLGAAVAILATLYGEVGIISNEKIKDLESTTDDSMDKRKHQTLSWIRKTIDFNDKDPLSKLSNEVRGEEMLNAALSRGRYI